MPTLAIRDQLRNLRLQNRKLACREANADRDDKETLV
jgi:hypothetical protein